MDGITTSINEILKNLIKRFNTLLDCPVRFSGEYGEEKVHYFIEYIEYYKRIKCITDEQALQELQYLLINQARDWWLRRKVNISTWSEALTILENQYSKKRPANAVYTEILKHHYEDYESKDDFIDDKIELLYELSEPEFKEKNILEIIYALLPNDIQNKIKLVSISTIKELKEQIKLAKLNRVDTSTNAVSESDITSEANIALSEVGNRDLSSNKPIFHDKDNQISIVNTSSENQADSIIKVRRTEDLMPQDIKEEENPIPQEEFLHNDNEISATNNSLHSGQDNFQIDTDIMNQINNIIDESEMNMNASSNNQVASTIPSKSSNCVLNLEFLGFHIEASNQSKKSVEHQSKSEINTTKKIKKRCAYCRRFNHTAQSCLKKAKHMETFPERFMQIKAVQNDNISPGIINKETAEALPINTSNCKIPTTNNPPPERLLTIPILLNQIATTSTPITDTSTAVTSSTLTLSNVAEKYINPILTTKLIAPINGKTPNKTLAAKLRSINTPLPKCHQCGTLGFYKSICPNCSPIYNNNSHNQYSK